MYEMLIHMVLIYISILFFFNYKQKTDFFATTEKTKFMKFV